MKAGQVLGRLSAPELLSQRAEEESRARADESTFQRLRTAAASQHGPRPWVFDEFFPAKPFHAMDELGEVLASEAEYGEGGFSSSMLAHPVGFEFCCLGFMIRRMGVPAGPCMSGKNTRWVVGSAATECAFSPGCAWLTRLRPG